MKKDREKSERKNIERKQEPVLFAVTYENVPKGRATFWGQQVDMVPVYTYIYALSIYLSIFLSIDR